jgi:hypothetical protein
MGFANYSALPKPLNTPSPFNPPRQKQAAAAKIVKPKPINVRQPALARPVASPGRSLANEVGAAQNFARRDQLVRPRIKWK